MVRRSNSRSWKLPLVVVAILGCALASAPPAYAIPGVGGLAKKAKEKAAKAAGVKDEAAGEQVKGDTNVEFNDEVLELTGDRIDRVIQTFQSAVDASAGRSELVDKLNKTSEERSSLWEKDGEKVMEIRQKRDEVEGCYHEGYQEAQERATQEYTQKAMGSDPALLQKFTRIAQEYNAASAKGDSAAMKAAHAELISFAVASKEDSIAVRKKCGPLPPPLPAEGKLDALDKQMESLSNQIRKIDEKVSEAQAKQGGMDRKQFGMAAERIQMYVAWRQMKSYSRSATRGFTNEEIEAMEKRLEKLIALFG
ncbi:MAG TPA: hypothetical protein VFU59_06565 [Candidatus Eisenbacteria bacterium]|nr:hypothetical protein [Candidatus Eisenbacteria bacterium]